jgi:hypothetical protein
MIYTFINPSCDGLSEWSARSANISSQAFILTASENCKLWRDCPIYPQKGCL